MGEFASGMYGLGFGVSGLASGDLEERAVRDWDTSPGVLVAAPPSLSGWVRSPEPESQQVKKTRGLPLVVLAAQAQCL